MPVPRTSLLGALAAVLTLPATAGAALPEQPTVIDGPSADLLGVDDVAMSQDGTGGLVYRKREGGRIHVYAARLVGGAWQGPQRVDVGQDYDSMSPAIGAGDGGRLVVTWIHQFGGGTQDRMYSATLGPGATSFQAPVAIDLDVRDGLDAAPSLSMNRGGTAYLTYRVVFTRSDPNLPPGTVDADIRVARFTGQYWSLLGGPVDRNPSQPMRIPTATNGPQIATDANGNAVVAWSEPDDDLIDRVYARRLFGQSPGLVLQASPATDPADAAKPLRAGPDQFSLDVSPFGAAAVGYRQPPASGSSFSRARAMVNELPAIFSEQAGAFGGARVVDGAGTDGPDALGPVSAAVSDDGAFVAAMGSGASALTATGTPTTLDPLSRLDDGTSSLPPDPLVDRGAEGELAAAYELDQGGADGIGLALRRADGTGEGTALSTPTGGTVTSLRLSGSGLGDAAVAFQQGDGAAATIAGATIDAPPEPFNVAAPLDFVRARKATISWEAAPAGIGGVLYTLGVDGQIAAEPQRGLSAEVNAAALGDGRHDVQVTATDPAGQTTQSQVAVLKVDRSAPRVTLRASGRKVRLTLRDAGSGLGGSSVVWGDGKRGAVRRSAVHRYTRAQRVRVVVTAKDAIGNVRTVAKTVRVR